MTSTAGSDRVAMWHEQSGADRPTLADLRRQQAKGGLIYRKAVDIELLITTLERIRACISVKEPTRSSSAPASRALALRPRSRCWRRRASSRSGAASVHAARSSRRLEPRKITNRTGRGCPTPLSMREKAREWAPSARSSGSARHRTIRKIATLDIQAEQDEGRLADGNPVDMREYVKAASAQRRLLAQLGFKASKPAITPAESPLAAHFATPLRRTPA